LITKKITGFKYYPINFKAKGKSGHIIDFKMYITDMTTLWVYLYVNINNFSELLRNRTGFPASTWNKLVDQMYSSSVIRSIRQSFSGSRIPRFGIGNFDIVLFCWIFVAIVFPDDEQFWTSNPEFEMNKLIDGCFLEKRKLSEEDNDKM